MIAKKNAFHRHKGSFPSTNNAGLALDKETQSRIRNWLANYKMVRGCF